ncbi:MAG: sugar phosphate isomerase/epimerase [Methanophagales archaeon ANME-1-THS]|nr:MAG: sugar phosphate isomerase/epimerase [Methanophagales archaeon ANME-1-THS]
MGMLLGAPVWYGNRPFRKTLEELEKLGLDFIEFSLDYPLPDCMDAAEKRGFKRVLEELDLKIGFHSPLDTAIAHPRDEVADACSTVLRACLAFSADFIPRLHYYNFHLNPRVPTFKLKDVREGIKIKGLERCRELMHIASELGVVMSVENDLVPFEWSDLILEALARFTPEIQLTFDVGHAIMAELIHSGRKMHSGSYQDYLQRWITRYGEKILVVHVHDCACTGDGMQDHLSLGSGELDFEMVFDLVKSTSCKYLVVETFWKNKEKIRMDYDAMRSNVEVCRSYL